MKQVQGQEIAGIELPRYTESDVVALQALNAGEANAEQQKRALKWIIENACAMYEWPFLDQERQTNIQHGRQLAGHQIVGMLKLKLSELRRTV